MAREIPAEEAIRDAAAESEYAIEEVERVAQVIHDAVQDNLYEHYDGALNSGGADNLLYEIGDEVIFALSPYDLFREVRDYGEEVENGLVLTAAEAFLKNFQAGGETVAVAGTLARSRDPPMFYPIKVFKTDEWKRGEAHALQMFEAYTSRAKMSASEALDYWATERMGHTPEKWAGYRDVGSEAVRKNRRQAKDKIGENGLGSGHENNNIHVAFLDDVPEDGPYDEDEDRYLVPEDGRLVWESGEE